eukprot:3328176-Pyramimonas_sp.AAC.1
MARGRHVSSAAGTLGGARHRGHEACEGCAEMARGRHASSAIGTSGGAPYGATQRLKGVPKWPEAAMRFPPLGPWVEIPMGPRNV